MALEARGILYNDARRQGGSVASAVYFPLFRKADTFPHPQAGLSFVSWTRSSAQGPDHVATPDRIGVLCTGQEGIWILGGQPAGSASDEKPRLREVNSRGQGLRGGTSTLSAPPLSGAPVLSASLHVCTRFLGTSFASSHGQDGWCVWTHPTVIQTCDVGLAACTFRC